MNFKNYLYLSVLLSNSLFSMEDKFEDIKLEQASYCCCLDNLFYKATKNFGRNDFLYLARSNSIWFLMKKIQFKEFIKDFDKYDLNFGMVFEDKDVSTYSTPLHEAIIMGNLKIVKLFCQMGADINKKIKSASDEDKIEDGDLTTEEYTRWYGHIFTTDPKNINEEETKKQIENFKKKHHVGFSAVELAESMVKESKDKLDERQEIFEFLRNLSKKD